MWTDLIFCQLHVVTSHLISISITLMTFSNQTSRKVWIIRTWIILHIILYCSNVVEVYVTIVDDISIYSVTLCRSIQFTSIVRIAKLNMCFLTALVGSILLPRFDKHLGSSITAKTCTLPKVQSSQHRFFCWKGFLKMGSTHQ